MSAIRVTQFETPESKPSASVVHVTPELAERWLGKNLKNRNISMRIAYAYAADMLNGNWELTGEAIKFAKDGSMIDGQHRCTAILLAAEENPDISIPMFIVRGLHNEAQNVMDTGKKRNVADSLTIDGVPNASVVAAAARVLYRVDHGTFFKDNKVSLVTASQIRSWIQGHPNFEEFVSSTLQPSRRVLAPPSITVAALYKMQAKNPGQAEEFLTRLDTLANLDSDDPIMVLHKRLTTIRTNRQKMTDRDYLALFFQAWNAMRAGKKLTRFQRPAGVSWNIKNFPWPK